MCSDLQTGSELVLETLSRPFVFFKAMCTEVSRLKVGKQQSIDVRLLIFESFRACTDCCAHMT